MMFWRCLILLTFLSPLSGWACEPPSLIYTFCKKQDPLFNLSKENLNQLNKAVLEYEKLRIQFAVEDDPKSKQRYEDGSCYLMNSASSYLGHLLEMKKTDSNRVCRGAVKELISSIDSLISPTSDIFNHVHTEIKVNTLRQLATKIQRLLEFVKSEIQDKQVKSKETPKAD